MNARVTALREQANRQLSSYDADQLAFLALASIKGVGFKTLVAMAAADTRFAHAIAIDNEDDAIELLRRFGARIDGTRGNDWRHVREQAIERAGRLAEALANDGITLIARTDPRFPKALLELSSPPHWLFVKGSVEVLQRPSLAIVGTREPSEDGRHYVEAYPPGRVHRAVPSDKDQATAVRRPMAARDQARPLPHHRPQERRAGEAL